MIITTILVLLLPSFAHVIFCDIIAVNARDGCGKSYTLCSPKGASSSDEPAISGALSTLFVDIVNTVDNNKNGEGSLQQDVGLLGVRASAGSLCCATGTQCLLLQDYKFPFCYDNYTTNYYLPGGAYGQIVSGNYTSSDGSIANLISGDYTLTNGTSGNIYGSPSSPSKPDTASLDIPTQYTAAGSISAIPVTALGQEITYTTTIPGTTIPPSIVSEVTSIPTVVGLATRTVVSTEAASTIPGSTVAARTSTVTTSVAVASAPVKGAANVLEPGATAMSFVFVLSYVMRRIFVSL